MLTTNQKVIHFAVVLRVSIQETRQADDLRDLWRDGPSKFAIVGLQLFGVGGISRQSINNLFISDWKKAQNNNFVVLCLF